MDMQRIIKRIPDYDVYLTVDEMNTSTQQLAREFPDLVRIQTVGKSQQGDLIQLISIGEGERNALVYAGAHANEVLGCMTAEFLSRHLCENDELCQELGYTWHFIKCIDPDSMRLNEGWSKGPYTELVYHANYFRQPRNEQPEYMFPIQDKTLDSDQPPPETRALKAAIDAVEPEFIWSLHNAELGGVYCALNRPCEPLHSVFPEIAEFFNLPFDLGETSLKSKVYAPAIKKSFSMKKLYETLLAAGVEDPAHEMGWRGTAAEYAEENYGTFYFLVEVPIWAYEAMGDTSPTDISRSDDVQQARSRSEAFVDWLGSHLDAVQDELELNTPFHRVTNEVLAWRRKSSSRLRSILMHKEADAERPATTAEHFSAVYGEEHMRQRMRGMCIRMLDAEIAAGNGTSAILAARDAVYAQFQEVGGRLENALGYSMTPIRIGVGFQTWVGLVVAEAIAS